MQLSIDPVSMRPYLMRAVYEWCVDHGFTPYLAVAVDDSVQVPKEFVRNNEIVLNMSFDATKDLNMANDLVSFNARFGGIAREIIVPVERVIAIYAQENGQGMAFPVAPPTTSAGPTGNRAVAPRLTPAPSPMVKPGPRLTAVADVGSQSENTAATEDDVPPPEPTSPSPSRPALKRIK
jgi:stringent starvation protein B